MTLTPNDLARNSNACLRSVCRLLLILLLELGERRGGFLVVRIRLEGFLELTAGVVQPARLTKIRALLIEILRFLARDRIGHRLLELAVVRHRRQSLLELHDGLIQVALLEEPLSALIIKIGRFELGLFEARPVFDVARTVRQRFAVLEHRLEPLVLRGIFLGLLDRRGSARGKERQRGDDG